MRKAGLIVYLFFLARSWFFATSETKIQCEIIKHGCYRWRSSPVVLGPWLCSAASETQLAQLTCQHVSLPMTFSPQAHNLSTTVSAAAIHWSYICTIVCAVFNGAFQNITSGTQCSGLVRCQHEFLRHVNSYFTVPILFCVTSKNTKDVSRTGFVCSGRCIQ